MSTSPLEGRLLSGYTIEAQDGNTCIPLGASVARDVVLNNLCHYADEFAQVRVAWASTASTYSGGQGYLEAEFAASNWIQIYESLPWPIPLRADGSTYRLRVRIGGMVSGVGGTATYRVTLCSPTYSPWATLGRFDDGIFVATTASTTPAWLTGVSQGPDASGTVIYLTPDDVARHAAIVSTATLDDLAGDPASVSQALVQLRVYVKTSNAASQPRLCGLYAAEWIGA